VTTATVENELAVAPPEHPPVLKAPPPPLAKIIVVLTLDTDESVPSFPSNVIDEVAGAEPPLPTVIV
jgi:hypothetical protein